MGSEHYGDELRKNALDELLKGERFVREVAEEIEVTTSTVRAWLKRHYHENPDDPRRHRIERESENYKREEGDDTPEGETGSDDEMAKRDRRSRVEPAIRVKILKEVKEAKRTRTEIAASHGLHVSTITYWLANPQPGDPGVPERRAGSEVAQQFYALLDEGKTVSEARTIVGTNGGRAKKLYKAWQRIKSLEKARAVAAEKRKDPNWVASKKTKGWRKREAAALAAAAAAAAGGQQQTLPLPDEAAASQTMTSRPEAEPQSRVTPSVAGQSMPSGLVRHSAVTQQQVVAMSDLFEEAVQERNALREMVKILQREADLMSKKLASYRRQYGDIQP